MCCKGEWCWFVARNIRAKAGSVPVFKIIKKVREFCFFPGEGEEKRSFGG